MVVVLVSTMSVLTNAAALTGKVIDNVPSRPDQTRSTTGRSRTCREPQPTCQVGVRTRPATRFRNQFRLCSSGGPAHLRLRQPLLRVGGRLDPPPGQGPRQSRRPLGRRRREAPAARWREGQLLHRQPDVRPGCPSGGVVRLVPRQPRSSDDHRGLRRARADTPGVPGPRQPACR